MERNYIKIIVTILIICITILSISVVNIYSEGYFFSELIVEGKSIDVAINTDKTEGVIPLEVNFTPIVLNSVGSIKYLWDFGDGFTSVLKKPSHTYINNGTYKCRVDVSDKNHRSSASIEITAKKNNPPIVSVTINKNTIERKYIPIIPLLYHGRQQQLINYLEKKDPYIFGEGQIESFAKIYDPDGDKIISYKWTVTPDTGLTIIGKPVYRNYTFNGTSIKLPELFTWRAARYVVRLDVEDSYGNKANDSLEFQVDKSTKETMRASLFYLIINLNSLFITLKAIWNFLKGLNLTKQDSDILNTEFEALLPYYYPIFSNLRSTHFLMSRPT